MRFAEILPEGRRLPSTSGLVNSSYFVETLSFGLDAAIALDTVERRRGTLAAREPSFILKAASISFSITSMPFLPCGAFRMPWCRKRCRYRRGVLSFFAVQLGPTYGGHFKVCPEASS